MKKSKILLPLALLGLVFGMAACNSGGEQGGNQKEGEQQQSADAPIETDPAKQEKINITSADGKKSILFGETLQLTAKIGENVLEGVTWESAKPDIATVSAAGLVTAVSKGSASIKASKAGYKDGSFSVSVNYPDITVTASGEKDILVGGTVTLTASEQGVTWTSSDPEVASVANGVVTGLKLGTATIKASKEHFNDGTAVINVVRPEVNLKVDLTTGAAHYSADGWWELPSAGGYGYAMQQVNGATPISQNQSWGQTEEPVDTFVGGFGTGDKETVSFTSSIAGKSEIVVNIGNSDAVTLKDVMSVKLNGTAIDLTGIELEAHTADYGGFSMSSLEFQDVSLGEQTLVASANTLEFEFLADTNVFLNEVSFYAGQATMALVNPPAKTQIAFTSTEVEVIEEATLQLAVDQTGVTWVSLDETIATVSDAGLVTGVKMGKVNIRAKKDGCYSAQIEITVNPKPVAGQIIVEAENGEEVSTEWGGSSYMKQEDGGMMGGSAVHSGGAYVTYFSMGGGDVDLTLTLKFQATEAKTMVLSIVGSAPASWGGEGTPYVFAESAQITFNEVAMTFTDQQFEAASGMNAPMNEVVLGDVNVQAGENTIVFHTTGSAPSIDCFKLSVKA